MKQEDSIKAIIEDCRNWIERYERKYSIHQSNIEGWEEELKRLLHEKKS